MRAKFNQSFKIQAVEKVLMRPAGTSMLEVADSLQVSLSSLNKWIVQSREQAFEPGIEIGFMSHSKEKRPQDWSLEERFQIIVKCEGLAKNEVSSTCRESGLHLHHLTQWKSEFTANKQTRSPAEKAEMKTLKNENKLLKKEVNRKDRALAETAALLVLQKKVNAIWGNDEDNLQ